jgi:UDP-N-acetylglucosamine 2-epimerase (non-hydrolysing)
VQEEACIFGVPNVTIRDVTERPETIECGSNVLASCEVSRILELVDLVTAERCQWQPPAEYLARNVSATVCRIVLGFRSFSPAGLDEGSPELNYLRDRQRATLA